MLIKLSWLQKWKTLTLYIIVIHLTNTNTYTYVLRMKLFLKTVNDPGVNGILEHKPVKTYKII